MHAHYVIALGEARLDLFAFCVNAFANEFPCHGKNLDVGGRRNDVFHCA